MERSDFDLPGSPLRGTNLIEASAGTGKTYSIAGLFVRLILEKEIPVREILVVTYTVAATEELRDRVRKKLRETAEAFLQGESADQFLHALLQKYPGETDRRLAGERLRAAIHDFDEAAIFTIHGFCQRVLLENAFESGSLFDTELVSEQEKLKEEIVEDFWRTRFYQAPPELVAYALSQGYSPRFFLALLGKATANPWVKIIPDVAPPSPDLLREAINVFRVAWEELKKIWPKAREEVREKLLGPALNATSYGKRTDSLLEAMDNSLASQATPFPLFEGFEKLTSEKIAASTKKNHSPPGHTLFHTCQSVKEKADLLKTLMDQRLLFLKTELVRTVRRELPARKVKKNIMFFDDLLFRLQNALEGKGGEELAKAVRAKYRAALIDEFQDTDPVQFTIFHAIFASEERILFFIGDPKQAIYSFRGADVFAYMKAASHTDGRYTLGENWRSDPALIKAINTVFSGTDTPFIYDEIPFSPARPAKDDGCEDLTIDGQREAPLQLWFLSSRVLKEGVGEGGSPASPGKLISKSRARELIARSVAGEISRLLSLSGRRQALIGQKPLREKDIAVLVRTNREARLVKENLSALKIPSVFYSTDSIFAAHEARELGQILIGIAAPHREELVRAALAADMIGVSGEELDRLVNDENAWGEWLARPALNEYERFRNYHELWQRYGFIVMFRSFMANEGVRTRLLCLPDGERRLTNVLHLAEILHRESMEQKLGMAGLIKWLGEQGDPETLVSDEHQLRLESDEDAVRIVTIHKSKGLEYPVVFCPFAWGGSKVSGPDFFFHDRADLPAAQGRAQAGEWQLTCDLGSSNSERHRMLAQRELLAENMRLLYVALTRAKNRCYLVWGRINEAGTSAPAYLFHRDQEKAAEDVIAATEERFKTLADEDLYRELESLTDKAEGTIRLEAMPLETGKSYSPPRQDEGETLRRREFSGKIDRSFRIASFSSLSHPFEAGLISGWPRSAELPDHDAHYPPVTGWPDLYPEEGAAFLHEGVPDEATPDESAGIFAFPKGARAGTLLHDILEHLDFTEKNETLTRNMVGNKLQEYGFEARWEDAVVGMIQKVISLPLDPDYPGGAGGSFTLSAIPQEERLQELEFYFPLKYISPETLRGIFAACGRTAPSRAEEGQGDICPLWHERLHFNPVHGFMKGFIDMVFRFEGRFYLVDWKSNFLGNHVTDYNQSAISETMAGSFYFLQYHIYTVALHQYLSTRLPGYRYDTHFGGVYYCFLRGMDPIWGPEYGVYRDRPSADLITALTRELIAVG
ncbi:MAG: exodeoxyribonuclease V subunit beta [Syntrophaceae bacterium CG2_30_49_12]|nr:MAG: exodeoxyribonuclease V subunit beta [Syntrophaceae bacterium CG2_30_49_12]